MSLTKVTDDMVLFDTGGGSSINFTSTTDFPLGSPVYFNGTTWNLAIATNDTTLIQYIISSKTGSSPISYVAITSGELTLTTGQWDAITSQSGGLTAGSTYYLSSTTAGRLSTSVGLIYAPVLRAISSTKAFVSLSINSIDSGMGDTFNRETTTTTGNTTIVTLQYPPAGKSYVWLSIDGVLQSGQDFDLAGNSLTLGSMVPTGTLIDVVYARAILLSDANAINRMVSFAETVSGSSKTVFNLPIAPSGVNSCMVFVGGAIQDPSKYNLNGSVLTMNDSVGVGIQLVAYVLNSSGITSSIDAFVTRKTYSLDINGTVTLSTIFDSQTTGLYRFFDMNDPRTSGNISVLHYGSGAEPSVRVDSNSSKVSIVKDTPSDLNIYIDSSNNNLITLQNKTTNSIALRIYREI